MQQRDLTLNCIAIGSLPHKDIGNAMTLVKENFSSIPFWPQLAKLSKHEDMIVQFLENLPGLVMEKDQFYIDNESDIFFEQLESLFMDYEEIISGNQELLNKYEITNKKSSTFRPFLDLIKTTRPKFAKGQIVGPFTLATSLNDKNGKCVYYDETLREVIVKLLTLKSLWQIHKIKEANESTTPIIFIDEPSISQLGTSAFITISKDEVISIIKEVSDLIKQTGALSAIHCCGKSDWSIPIESKVDIINLDGYFFAQNLSLFSEELKPFLKNGGIIAWGIIPTLDKEALEKANVDLLEEKFEEAIDYLIKKGVNETLLIRQSMITPSCGAGSLNEELTQKAMKLTKELSIKLREKYKSQGQNN